MINPILTFFFHAVAPTLALEHLVELGLLMLVGNWIWTSSREERSSNVLKGLKLFQFGFFLPLVGKKVIHDWNCSVHP